MIVGQATAQANTQDVIQSCSKPGTKPTALTVATSDTRKDMMPETMNPNTIGERRFGIMTETPLTFVKSNM